MRPVLREDQTGPGDEILDGTRDKDLVRAGQTGDARADMHRDPHHPVAGELALAGVQPGANLKS